jgi:hypothetical protein
VTTYWLSFGTRAVCTGIMIVEADAIRAAIARARELRPDQPIVTGWTLEPSTPEGHRLLALLPRETLLPRAEVRRLERLAELEPS